MINRLINRSPGFIPSFSSRLALPAIIAGCAAILQGCTAIYLPAIYDSNFPASAPLRQAEKSLTHVGGDFHYSNGYNANESHVLGRGHASWSTGGNGYRILLDGFAYGGNYHVTQSSDTTELGNQPYFGIGGQADLNVCLPTEPFTVGIGANAGFATEFGPYAKVYKEDAPPIIPLIGVYAFLDYTLAPRQRLGLQVHIGLPGGLSTNLQFDNGDYLLWTGFGASIGSDNGGGTPLGRFAAGTSFPLP